MESFKKYFAEFIGTFVLVVFGCGSAVVGNTKLSVAFAFGLVIVAMAYSIGNISGCHINPAVSTAMLILKKISVTDFIGYLVAQFLGGIAGAAVILGVLSGVYGGFGANSRGVFTIAEAFIAEVILTFVFIIAIVGVTSKKEFSSISGVIIGLTLTLVHILGIPITGTSVNPARSLGPAIFTGGEALTEVWIYILAPILGAVLAAYTYKFLSCECCSKAEEVIEENDDIEDEEDADAE